MKNPVQLLNDASSISLKNLTNAIGYSLPIKTGSEITDKVDEFVSKRAKLNSTFFQVPIVLRLSTEPEDGGFKFPLDPVVSISGKNIITRRYVNKSSRPGSVKEQWSQDDWDITISGVLTSDQDDDYTVEEFLQSLKKYCDAKESVAIVCGYLNEVYNINYITIESYDFPFTKGIQNQSFTLKCYSDESYNLLIE